MIESVSFDRDAANMFQQYVNGELPRRLRPPAHGRAGVLPPARVRPGRAGPAAPRAALGGRESGRRGVAGAAPRRRAGLLHQARRHPLRHRHRGQERAGARAHASPLSPPASTRFLSHRAPPPLAPLHCRFWRFGTRRCSSSTSRRSRAAPCSSNSRGARQRFRLADAARPSAVRARPCVWRPGDAKRARRALVAFALLGRRGGDEEAQVEFIAGLLQLKKVRPDWARLGGGVTPTLASAGVAAHPPTLARPWAARAWGLRGRVARLCEVRGLGCVSL